HHFLDDVDVGPFQIALAERAEAVFTRVALRGRAAGRGLRVEIATEALQAAWVVEARELHAEGLVAGRGSYSNIAARIDGYVGGIGRNRLEVTEQRQAVAGRDFTVGGNFQGAVASVSDGAIGLLHGEEAVALDGHVEFLAGLGELALAEI